MLGISVDTGEITELGTEAGEKITASCDTPGSIIQAYLRYLPESLKWPQMSALLLAPGLS